MKLNVVSPEEFASLNGATHVLEVDFSDFAGDATTGARTLTLDVPAGTSVKSANLVLAKPFKNSDTGFVSLLVEVGSNSDADAFITSTQICERGTEVTFKEQPSTTPYTYASAGTLNVLLTPTSGKAIADLTEGKLLVPLVIRDLEAIRKLYQP